MGNLKIEDATNIPAANLASTDVIPLLDVSAPLGGKGSKITAENLSNGLWNLLDFETLPDVSTTPLNSIRFIVNSNVLEVHQNQSGAWVQIL